MIQFWRPNKEWPYTEHVFKDTDINKVEVDVIITDTVQLLANLCRLVCWSLSFETIAL